jgi:hypothetical protein
VVVDVTSLCNDLFSLLQSLFHAFSFFFAVVVVAFEKCMIIILRARTKNKRSTLVVVSQGGLVGRDLPG